MTITLTPEVEGKLMREANQYGTTPEMLALETLRERFAEPVSALDGMPLDLALAELIAEAETLEAQPPTPGTKLRNFSRSYVSHGEDDVEFRPI